MTSRDWGQKRTSRARRLRIGAQRLRRASLTHRNVGASHTPGNRSAETRLAGCGRSRLRTRLRSKIPCHRSEILDAIDNEADRWAPRGMRLTAKVPHGHWKTTTFLAALRQDRIDAPWVLDGPIYGETFRTYVEKVLVPTLGPGDIVIMDNLGSHKGKAVRQLIRSAGAKLFFLPKY